MSGRTKRGRNRGATPQTEKRIKLQVSDAFQYLLALPEDYAAGSKRRWPLLVFLHGAGERGNDLACVRRHGPPRLIDEGRRFPAIVVSPQCPAATWWNLPAVEALIDQMVSRHRVDPRRIYLTGLSMGGYGTWGLAQRRPRRYAAIVPICGGGDPEWGPRLRDVPVWAFHGGRDKIVPALESQQMIGAIRAAGGAPRLTLYPEARHDSWTEAYANEALWSWLFTQQLPAGRR